MSEHKGVSLQDHIGRWQAVAKAKPIRDNAAVGRKQSVHATLADMLTTAIELEFATIPLYLCALWSIKDDLHPVAKSLREIVQEEMLHMGLTCNMLAAIGYQPPIRRLAPTYPSGLPGDVHPGLTVHLQGLNKDSLRTFLQIESPAKLAASVPVEEGDLTWPEVRTIGQFYECVMAAFEAYAADGGIFHVANQVSASLVWRVIGSPEDAKTAIRIITTQGEGATVKSGPAGSPRDSGREDYAHYYRFLEVWKEKRLVRLDKRGARTERYEWRDGYKLPDCHPMGLVPNVGFPDAPPEVMQLLNDFDETYHDMLDLLESAWLPGGQGQLVHAIAKMFELERYAKPLMAISRLDDPKLTYGPLFSRPKEQTP